MKCIYHEWATTIRELKCAPARDRMRDLRVNRLSKSPLRPSSAMKFLRNPKSFTSQVLHHERSYFYFFVFRLKPPSEPCMTMHDKFCPWLTSDFKLMCKARDKLKKQAIRSNSELLMQSYRHIRNQVNKSNGQLKRES